MRFRARFARLESNGISDVLRFRSDPDTDEEALADTTRSLCTCLLYSSLLLTASRYSALSLVFLFQRAKQSLTIKLRAEKEEAFSYALSFDNTCLLLEATLPFTSKVVVDPVFDGLFDWRGKGNLEATGDVRFKGLNMSADDGRVCSDGNPFRDLFDKGSCNVGVFRVVEGKEMGSTRFSRGGN
jgi:hypothetical protein